MSKREDRKVFHKRCFLNEKEGPAVIETKLEDGRWKKDDGTTRYHYDGTAHITDCSRSVTLGFYFHDKKSAEAALRKIDRLMAALGGLRHAVYKEAGKEFGIK